MKLLSSVRFCGTLKVVGFNPLNSQGYCCCFWGIAATCPSPQPMASNPRWPPSWTGCFDLWPSTKWSRYSSRHSLFYSRSLELRLPPHCPDMSPPSSTPYVSLVFFGFSLYVESLKEILLVFVLSGFQRHICVALHEFYVLMDWGSWFGIWSLWGVLGPLTFRALGGPLSPESALNSWRQGGKAEAGHTGLQGPPKPARSPRWGALPSRGGVGGFCRDASWPRGLIAKSEGAWLLKNTTWLLWDATW